MLPKERHKPRRRNSIKWRLVLHQIDNELERCARELIAYLDNDAEVERALPSSVGFMVKQMRAAIFAKATRTLERAHRCRIYRQCRPWWHQAIGNANGGCRMAFALPA